MAGQGVFLNTIGLGLADQGLLRGDLGEGAVLAFLEKAFLRSAARVDLGLAHQSLLHHRLDEVLVAAFLMFLLFPCRHRWPPLADILSHGHPKSIAGE